MKLISVGLIIAMGINFGALANDQSLAEESLSKILNCSRKIVEEFRGQDQGLLFVGKLLDDIREDKAGELEPIKLAQTCHEFKNSFRKSISINRDEVENKIESLKVSKATKDLIKPFNKPYFDCQFTKIEKTIALGLGVRKGLGATKCEGTNGRSYIFLIPKEQFNLNFLSQIFSSGSQITEDNQIVGIENSFQNSAAAEFLGSLFDSGTELDQIGLSADFAKSKAISGLPRFTAISL
ncbi:MAG: hypothetical protein CME70_17515 [Halobacteriovorax sp.]|nr:hypothetical protein [Halobacteriovorax sp.]